MLLKYIFIYYIHTTYIHSPPFKPSSVLILKFADEMRHSTNIICNDMT